MPFKKLDTNTLILIAMGVLVILASAGLAAWLYQSSPVVAQPTAEPTAKPTEVAAVVQGKALTTDQATALGIPTAEMQKQAARRPQQPSTQPTGDTDKALEVLETPKYVSNAEAGVTTFEKRPKVAIVIDDVGVHSALSRKADKVLPPEVTFSFLPYGSATMELAKKARKEGREVMIHLPMEPMPRLDEPPIDPGPNALFVELSPEEMRKRTQINLKDLKDMSVGVNNHMGSRFTSDLEGMKVVLPIIEESGLFFMDSLTTPNSAVEEAAKAVTPNMPLLKRDVFLDHYITEDALRAALQRLEKEAQATGKAIAIGHPHSRTLSVLQDWLPTLPYKGIDLVPITHMLADDTPAFEPSAPALPKGIAAPQNSQEENPSDAEAPTSIEEPQQPEPMHVINPEDPNGTTRLY